MNKLMIAAFALAASCAVQAQQPAAGVAVKASEPGKAAAAAAVEVRARVVGIDKAARSLDLKRADGSIVALAVGDEVKNFDQINLGDDVVVQYVRALSLELLKSRSSVAERDVKSDAVRAKPGERPGAAAGRQVRVIANVVAVDKKAGTITLKGPRGNQVELKVEDKRHFDVVKKGDQVEAIYTEAVAVSVQAPSAKPAAKK